MGKRIGIVNVNLEYEIPEGQDAEEFLSNVELPKEYLEDSFEIVKIMHYCPYCEGYYDSNDGHSCERMRNKDL